MVEFFYPNKDLHIHCKDNNLNFNFKGTEINPNGTHIWNSNDLYVATMQCIGQIQTICMQQNNNCLINFFYEDGKKQFINSPQFPISLGNTELQKFTNNEIIPELELVPIKDKIQTLKQKGITHAKVCIINGVGTGIGDSIIGLTAIKHFRYELSKHFDTVEINLFYSALVGDNGRFLLYTREAGIDNVCALPTTFTEIINHNLIVDFSGLIKRESFIKLPMIDFFLQGLGVDYKKIPDSEKRNKLHYKQQSEIDGLLDILPSGKKVMLHLHSSSATRTAPDRFVTRIVNKLMKETELTIITAQPVNLDLVSKYKGRIFDLSRFNKNLWHLVGIIDMADYVICTDTSVTHIADSLNKPTVAIFPNIDPKLRTCYYPTVESISLHHEFNDLHFSDDPKVVKEIQNRWLKDGLASEIVKRIKE